MFQNIRKQKEHAYKVGYAQGYAQFRQDMGLPPVPVPAADKPAPAASVTLTSGRVMETIRRFSVVEDGVVKIPADTLDIIWFMVTGTDDADTPVGR